MIDTQILMNIFVAVMSAFIYGLVFFSKKYVNTQNPESIDYIKLASTLVISFFIGIAGYFAGIDITYENITTIMTSYVGIVAIVETLIKTVVRIIKAKS